ncbi:ferrous iron transport protein B [Desulfoferrobacter suflitae]|uniref:ferrous iron transport protein B n=1 Tax=Desulfoferrobacter suflitae TaxID=2865782 RepID=UPI0021647B0D|nr:ferrous iron transport protein B [Desulfoferrobacter suflitae]MCK8601030.1 ferrous iron transport protein B [Desulfoferrobacter suflitae]
MTASAEYLIALAGNPNCGKTTLFNAITGARQHVGNYPGITVEKKEGVHLFNGLKLRLVDLPGTYSLTAYSMEELVARDFLALERPQLVINIVDASNLERNLYLTIQILELGIPVVLALNMVDAAASRGIEIDAEELSRRLQIPVIPTVARSGTGKLELLEKTAEVAAENRSWKPLHISYGADIDPVLDQMETDIAGSDFLLDFYPARWIALKYLEADEQVINKGAEVNPELSSRLEALADHVAEHLQKTLETYPEAIIADHRYGFISAVLKAGVVHNSQRSDRLYLSDQLDQVLTNRFFGPLIMLVILYAVYKATFDYSALPVEWLNAGFTTLSAWMQTIIPPGLLQSLIVSGIIDGVGGVLSFIPLILFMFFAIAFLEDTGYLARVAYMLDRVFRTFGLHGSSVMAYIVSGGIAGGCAVPGVMATRTLRSPRERLATLLTAPFMNCGAKLPVFAMLIAAFFPARHAQMMFLLTIFSWIAALSMARIIRWTILRGPSTPFLLELPPYRMPTLKGLLIHTWERTWQYIRKAGTIILALSILFWALMTFPLLPDARKSQFEADRQQILSQLPEDTRTSLMQPGIAQDGLTREIAKASQRIRAIDRAESEATLQHSYAGRIGMALETLTQWSGFEWRTNVALLAGFAAKELIISTLGTAYSLGGADLDAGMSLSRRLASDPQWNRLRAFSLIVFIMLYAPCLATVTCIAKESGAVKWALFSLAFNTTAAYLISAAIYQGGLWMGIGG